MPKSEDAFKKKKKLKAEAGRGMGLSPLFFLRLFLANRLSLLLQTSAVPKSSFSIESIFFPFSLLLRNVFGELKHASSNFFPSFKGFCNVTWDDFLCWPLTPAGTQVKKLDSAISLQVKYFYLFVS